MREGERERARKRASGRKKGRKTATLSDSGPGRGIKDVGEWYTQVYSLALRRIRSPGVIARVGDAVVEHPRIDSVFRPLQRR